MSDCDCDSSDTGRRIWVNDFDESDVRALQRGIDLSIAEHQTFAAVFIDSYGGDATGLAAMLDIIAASPIPVATIAIGKAMSAGAILLAAGTPSLRFAAPSVAIMIHEMLVGHRPQKMPEYMAMAAQSKRENAAMIRRLDRACGKQPGYWHSLIRAGGNADFYLDAKAAKKHGLVDHIGLPALKSSSSRHVELQFNWPVEKPKRKPRK